MKYLTFDSKVLEVLEDGIVPGTFCCFWRSPSGALNRRRSVDLPDRKTREEAQADLDLYARKNRFPEVDE